MAIFSVSDMIIVGTLLLNILALLSSRLTSNIVDDIDASFVAHLRRRIRLLTSGIRRLSFVILLWNFFFSSSCFSYFPEDVGFLYPEPCSSAVSLLYLSYYVCEKVQSCENLWAVSLERGFNPSGFSRDIVSPVFYWYIDQFAYAIKPSSGYRIYSRLLKLNPKVKCRG